MYIMNFTNDLKVPMIARIVTNGDRYGMRGCLTYQDTRPLLEFYDARYDHNDWLGLTGQFITRYYLDTIEEDQVDLTRRGLDLDGGIADWKVDPTSMQAIFRWLDRLHAHSNV